MTKKDYENLLAAAKMRILICQQNFEEFEEILGEKGIEDFINLELEKITFILKRLQEIEKNKKNEKK